MKARLWKNERGEVLRLYWSSATDDGLALLDKLPSLQDVNLETSQNITEAGLTHLKGLAKLRRLSLCETQTTDAGLAHLAGLTELEELQLSDNRITDAGMAHLKGMTKLKKLNLNHASAVASGVWITDMGIAQLAGMNELRILEIEDTRVTDVGLRQLSGLTKLEILGLRSNTVDDRALAHVTALQNLTNLGLQYTAVTDAGLKQLASLPHLQSLSLSSNVITDEGLANLKPLAHVGHLELRGRRFTDAALARVAALPSLRALHLVQPMDERKAQFTAAGLKHLKGASKLEDLSLFKVHVARAEAEQLAQLSQLNWLMLDFTEIGDADVQYLRRALPNVQISVGTGAGIKTYGPPLVPVVVQADAPLKQRIEETLKAMSQRDLPYRVAIVEGIPSPNIGYRVVEVTRAANGEYRLVVTDPTKDQKDDTLATAFQAVLPRLREQEGKDGTDR
ncbi:MAG: leucine-rich repeat domain-containing protein [Pirellulales bacterium]